MRTAKKFYFTINEITLELKGPYARLELFEIINVSQIAFRMRFCKNDKVFHPRYVYTPARGFYIIRDIELDIHKDVAGFIEASKNFLENYRKTRELNNKNFNYVNLYDRKPKGNRKILKSDFTGNIPKFKIKTLNIYTGEVTHYESAKEFAETENYLLKDVLACIEISANPIFQGKLILLKYTKSKEKPFRIINDFKNEIYYPNLPVILETNMKTQQQKVYTSSNELCKHIPFDTGELMFSLRYEGGFTFNECFYKLINN